jgi:tetratricopeptide (TPR) repeat protein
MPKAKVCFFITPIGKPESQTRERSNLVYRRIVQPAAKACGYVAVRADNLRGTRESITSKILEHLKHDPMVVADLTGMNANVFFATGYRRALGKPVAHLIQRGHRLPFDVIDIPTVFVDLDVDEVVEARAKLAEKIREAEKETGRSGRRTKKVFPKVLSSEDAGLLGSAFELKRVGAYRDALARADLLIVHRPDIEKPYQLKGRIYLENLRQYKDAAKQFEMVLKIDPSNRAALYDLAITHYYMRNLEEALKWNQKVLDRYPDFILAIYNHAIYCVDYGKEHNKPELLDKAVGLYQDVIERNLEYAESAMFNLAALYADSYEKEKDRKAKNQYVKKAVSLLDKAIKRQGLERLRKVTGKTPVPYGSNLKKISRHTAYKELIAKWKKVLRVK